MTLNTNELGQLRTQVGTIKGKQLRFLGQVGDCLKDKCPIKHVCKFKPKGRCTVVYNFLTSLYLSWVDPVDGLGDILTQIQFDRIGIHLIPLYHQLIRFQLETIPLEEMTYENRAGTKSAYPQYREIREIQHQIRLEHKDLRLHELWEKKFGKEKAPPTTKGLDDMRDGRFGAYEAMVEQAKKAGKKNE